MPIETSVSSGSTFLMEGALGERLKREYNLSIDGPVAMASLIYDEKGRGALGVLWKEYLTIAERYRLPFLATTPTRRANKERVESGGFDESIIADNVQFLHSIKQTASAEMFIGGLMGCKGDAYTGEETLSFDRAKEFHSWQCDLFKKTSIDFLYAGIMPVLEEAAGMAAAMAQSGFPYIISFTIQRNGRLIDGNTIDFAIRYIDGHVSRRPLCYMTNCVHPDIVYRALSHSFNQTETVRSRFIGIQANTSALDYADLDGTKELKTTSPVELANSMARLKSDFNFTIFGGCCGTDNRHMDEIARQITGKER
ncbi:MAG: homocysteine S-methyltransferase family protein [Bacteroidales bacterium]